MAHGPFPGGSQVCCLLPRLVSVFKKGEEEEGRKKFLLSNYLTESANPRASPKDEKCKFIELFD